MRARPIRWLIAVLFSICSYVLLWHHSCRNVPAVTNFAQMLLFVSVALCLLFPCIFTDLEVKERNLICRYVRGKFDEWFGVVAGSWRWQVMMTTADQRRRHSSLALVHTDCISRGRHRMTVVTTTCWIRRLCSRRSQRVHRVDRRHRDELR